MTPTRVKLSRRPGARKPAGAVVVSRPSRWGNPYTIAEYGSEQAVDSTDGDWPSIPNSRRPPAASWPVRTWRAGATLMSCATQTSCLR